MSKKRCAAVFILNFMRVGSAAFCFLMLIKFEIGANRIHLFFKSVLHCYCIFVALDDKAFLSSRKVEPKCRINYCVYVTAKLILTLG